MVFCFIYLFKLCNKCYKVLIYFDYKVHIMSDIFVLHSNNY